MWDRFLQSPELAAAVLMICASVIGTGFMNWTAIKKHLLILETKLTIFTEHNNKEHQDIKVQLEKDREDNAKIHSRVTSVSERVAKIEGGNHDG